jgi:hypothetical protein
MHNMLLNLKPFSPLLYLVLTSSCTFHNIHSPDHML